MIFVKTNDLKAGMRLARPIYNKSGVLLYERNSKISGNAIASIKNFGLLGMYILEPAEPVPPMTKDDVEFERFQTMAGFLIEEELNHILQHGRAPKMQTLARMVLKNYAHLDHKINFNQNLRSREDYTYKHSMNAAILCAMMTHVMNIRLEEQLCTIIAAIVHDVGKVSVNKEVADCDEMTEEKKLRLVAAETGRYDLIQKIFGEGAAIRRICAQSQKVIEDCEEQRPDTSAMKMVTGARILAVAGVFDSLTAMQIGKEPASEVKALKYLMDNPAYFDQDVVLALVKSINILVPGVSVELNTGEKALVIKENTQNILRPVVLNFRDNSVLDLSNDLIYEDIWIQDIMRTMDNRHVMDIKTLKERGFCVEEPVYAELQQAPQNK